MFIRSRKGLCNDRRFSPRLSSRRRAAAPRPWEPLECRQLINGPLSLGSALDPASLITSDPLAAAVFGLRRAAPGGRSGYSSGSSGGLVSAQSTESWSLSAEAHAPGVDDYDSSSVPPGPSSVSASAGGASASSTAGTSMHSEAAMSGGTGTYSNTGVNRYTDAMRTATTGADAHFFNGSGASNGTGDINWGLNSGGSGTAVDHSEGGATGHGQADGSSPNGTDGDCYAQTAAEGGGTNASDADANFSVSPAANGASGGGHSRLNAKGFASHSANVFAPTMNRVNVGASGRADADGRGSQLDALSTAQVNENNPGVPGYSDIATASSTAPNVNNPFNTGFTIVSDAGSANGLNSVITAADSGVRNATVRSNPYGQSSATAKGGAFGGAGDYGRGHIAGDSSLSNADHASSSATATADPLVGPLGVTLNGSVTLDYAGTGGTASGGFTGDGNSADNNPTNDQVLVFTADTSGSQGADTYVHFDGDSPQVRSGGATTSNTTSGDLWVNTNTQTNMAGNASVDTTTGGANNDADVFTSADASSGSTVAQTNEPGATAEGHSTMDDGGALDTASNGSADVSVALGSVGHGSAHGNANNSPTATAAPSVDSSVTAWDGATGHASADVQWTSGLGLSSLVDGSTPVSSVANGDEATGTITGNVKPTDGNFNASLYDQSLAGQSSANVRGRLTYNENFVNMTQGALFVLTGMTLLGLSGNDGVSYAHTTVTLTAGVDSDGDGDIDSQGFSASASVNSDNGTTTLVTSGGWTNSSFSFDPDAGTATLLQTRLYSSAKPASGQRLIVMVDYEVDSVAAWGGGDGEIDFNG